MKMWQTLLWLAVYAAGFYLLFSTIFNLIGGGKL